MPMIFGWKDSWESTPSDELSIHFLESKDQLVAMWMYDLHCLNKKTKLID